MRSRLIAASLGVLITLFLPVGAWASARVTVEVSSPEVAGEPVDVEIRGMPSGSKIDVYAGSRMVASTSADFAGTGRASFEVPPELEGGQVPVVAVSEGPDGLQLSGRADVELSSPDAWSGSGPGGMLLVGCIAVLCTGSAAVIAGHRRRLAVA